VSVFYPHDLKLSQRGDMNSVCINLAVSMHCLFFFFSRPQGNRIGLEEGGDHSSEADSPPFQYCKQVDMQDPYMYRLEGMMMDS
jgi:hypothetical protein